MKAHVLEITKKVKIKGLVKKSSISPLFSQSLFALRWMEGWEMKASFLLPGVQDIPAG